GGPRYLCPSAAGAAGVAPSRDSWLLSFGSHAEWQGGGPPRRPASQGLGRKQDDAWRADARREMAHAGVAADVRMGERERARELGQRRLDEALRRRAESDLERLDGVRIGGALVHHDLEAAVSSHALQGLPEPPGGPP